MALTSRLNVRRTQGRFAIKIAAALIFGWVVWYAFCRLWLDDSLADRTAAQDHRGLSRCLAWGADPNALFDGNEPPLVPAAENRDAVAVKMLLDHGAKIELLDGHHQRLVQQIRGKN